jgi:hypothetical protein
MAKRKGTFALVIGGLILGLLVAFPGAPLSIYIVGSTLFLVGLARLLFSDSAR